MNAMAHIKKVVMQGFKSFARRTEIPFDTGVNVIIGPNGSGKSNISDAICFALGRLSAKSMRAEKAKNLIFMGSKYVKPAREAFVELVFDNSDKVFGVDTNEVTLRREIKNHGGGTYKINGETKNRGDVIELLGQAGIDPYGYNMILQGQIQGIVRMHPDERRGIIGEVAGISVYEWRKQQSLKELEKTEGRLKEISTILREKNAYLNNLEKEKSQAQRYTELQMTLKRAKASIVKKKLDNKLKEIENIAKGVETTTHEKDKKQEKVVKIQKMIDEFSEKINSINKEIRHAGGVEQSTLREQITNLKAELEGMKVRREGQENRKQEVERRIEQMKKSIPEMEDEIKKLRAESPLMERKVKELKKKKDELSVLEEERRKILTFKTNLANIKERIEEKKRQLTRTQTESSSLLKHIEEISATMKFQSVNDVRSLIEKNKIELSNEKNTLKELGEKEITNEKIISVAESVVRQNEEIKKKVETIDTCPLCQSNITEEHIQHVFSDCDEKIKHSQTLFDECTRALTTIRESKQKARNVIDDFEKHIHYLEKEVVMHTSVDEKKEILKKSVNAEEIIQKELAELNLKRGALESKGDDFSSINEKYQNTLMEIEEISSRTEQNIDTTLLHKEHELERIRNIIKQSGEDMDSIHDRIVEISSEIELKEDALDEKEKQAEELNVRFNALYKERDSLQKNIQETSIKLSEMQNEVRQIEDQVNYLRIGKAKFDGEKETIETDLKDYVGVELLQGSLDALEERLKKTQETLQTIGSINMRALEVYDEVKKEYDVVKQKVDTLDQEKIDIMKIVEEIDKKKKKTFMKAFNGINELFSRNFSRLSSKGVAYLEPENKENLFEGGIDIVVKMAKGKYFDVNSLSGGEQTLVALSLLFAIQEYKPYHFYLLDEVDAALDKRNSERLAGLLNQYMKAGQYIVVTHNDAIILDSQILYGVSMHEGVSKVMSLDLGSLPSAQLAKENKTNDVADNEEMFTPMITELPTDNLQTGNDGK